MSNVAEISISVTDRVKNILGKEEDAGYQHCLIFPQCVQRADLPHGRKKLGLCG